ncbi:hypothetical protein ACQI5H_09055 [Mycobacterium heidelbergense]|uniref:hypothetical protein n=1 Tax=Mycobacterium heidelbergense TaxID=53376 RepID=UPI003CE7A0BE
MWVNAPASVAARFGAAALVIAGWAVSAGVAYGDPEPAPEPSPAEPPAAAPANGPKTSIDHDGTFAVGTDIAPGTYSTAGPVANGTCYWKRMGNPDGNLIDNSMSKKPQVVRIEPTDKAFKTDGCQPWQQTDAAPPPDASGPAAGAQLQGTLGILNGLLGGNNQQVPHS